MIDLLPRYLHRELCRLLAAHMHTGEIAYSLMPSSTTFALGNWLSGRAKHAASGVNGLNFVASCPHSNDSAH